MTDFVYSVIVLKEQEQEITVEAKDDLVKASFKVSLDTLVDIFRRAVGNNDVAVVKEILAWKIITKNLINPFYYLSRKVENDLLVAEMAKMLIDYGFNFSSAGYYFVGDAAANKQFETVKMYVTHGAVVTDTVYFVGPFLQAVKSQSSREIIEYLYNHGGDKVSQENVLTYGKPDSEMIEFLASLRTKGAKPEDNIGDRKRSASRADSDDKKTKYGFDKIVQPEPIDYTSDLAIIEREIKDRISNKSFKHETLVIGVPDDIIAEMINELQDVPWLTVVYENKTLTLIKRTNSSIQ